MCDMSAPPYRRAMPLFFMHCGANLAEAIHASVDYRRRALLQLSDRLCPLQLAHARGQSRPPRR